LAIWAFEKPDLAASAASLEHVEAAMFPAPEKEKHPTDYFAPPVAGGVHLTGTCGELRPNHFHAGLDIDGVTGDPVFASADGYIETIKVQASGYGNVLYLRHTNGYLSLYAHLDRFSADIQAFVRKNQYEREQFEVELKPPPDMFVVKQGKQIGYLGNTGSSGGPHLHFEIRSPSGKAINPLLCGIPVVDNIAPEIRDLKAYFLNDRREVLGSKTVSLKKDKKGLIGLEGDTIRLGGWRIGFGVKTYDRSNSRRNDNGVYAISLFTDGKLAFQWTADEFDFDDTRYLNAHIDYPVRQRQGAWFHRCFTLPGDFLSNYTRTETMGAIEIFTGKPVQITLKVSDASGNTSTLNFWVLRDAAAMESFISPPYQFLLPFDAESHLDLEDISVAWPKGAFYEHVPLQYKSRPGNSGGIFSAIHQLHEPQTPVHKYFDIKIKPSQIPPELRSKVVVAEHHKNRHTNCGGTWQGEWLSTRARSFGEYCVMTDTTPPRITALVFASDMSRKTEIAFRILDDFGVSGEAKGMRYRGTIDGRWVLFEYDKKRNRISYRFDEKIGKGEHNLRLSVKDDRDNESVFKGKFLR